MPGNLFVGNNGTGTLGVASGGVVSSGGGYIGNFSSSRGTATVTGAGSTWTNSGGFFIGFSGTGTLAVEAGGVVSSAGGGVGETNGSSGTATVTGAGSSWTNSSSITIGSGGRGVLTVAAGGTLSSAGGAIGQVNGSSGTATITGAGSTWTNSSSVVIGNIGTGTLAIAAGGAVSNTSALIGGITGANGTATVSGAGSRWTNSGTLNVGFQGTGTLAVTAGGVVSSAGALLAGARGANGTATVSGTGSTWTNSGALAIGSGGQGALTVATGGTVSSSFGDLGSSSGGSGTATVTGAGASWISSGGLSIGREGTGALNIAAGGTVSNTFSDVGSLAGGIGTATVTGAGSRWVNSGPLTIGFAGSGTLTTADGGTVSVGGGTGTLSVASRAGSTGTLVIGASVGQAVVAAGTLQAAMVTFGAGTGTLVFNHTGNPDGSAATFAPRVTGTGSVQQLAGTTVLTGANTYGGVTTISGGVLAVRNGTALGAADGTAANGTTVASGAALELSGGVAVGNEALRLAGTGVANGGAFRNLSDNNRYAGAITLAADGRINSDAGTLSLSGTISGTGSTRDLTLGGAGDGLASGNIRGNLGNLAKDGAGTWRLTGASTVADSITVDNGTLDLRAGGTISSDETIAGSAATTAGAITVSDAGSNWNSRLLRIGDLGAGTLTVQDRASVTSGNAYIGFNPSPAGAAGAVLVAGASSRWTSGLLLIGRGSLTVADGATVSSGIAFLEAFPGSDATATVTGAGSAWTNSITLSVGHFGRGSLVVAAGGAVSSAYGDIGDNAGSDGTATVSGGGSVWRNANTLIVGVGGTGALRIEAGGSASDTLGLIGVNSGSDGAVTVTGTGSTWENFDSLVVGSHGSATLVVQNGGVVSTGGGTGTVSIAEYADAVSALIIGSSAGSAPVAAGTLSADRLTFGAGAGRLVFNHTGNPDGTDYAFAPVIAGAGTVEQRTGTTVMTGANTVSLSFTGTASVSGGRLAVNGTFGDLDAAGGLNQAQVNVTGTGVLGGAGTIAGRVTLGTGGTLAAGNSPGTLAVNGDLTLGTGSRAVFELGAPNAVANAANDLVRVGGDLAIDSGATLALQTASGAQVASGYYTLFDVTGTATGRFGTVLNSGANATADVRQLVVVDGAASQFQALVANGGQVVQFWDGAGTANDGAASGGAGTWSGAVTNWTTVVGDFNGTWQSEAGVFGGASGGAVTVAGTQGFEALQFTTNGYRLDGGGLLALADGGRVSTDASVTVESGVAATIANPIGGTAGLTKLGGGTLALAGANGYAGGTTVSGGTLSVSSDANLGAAGSRLTLDGGTLAAAASLHTGRAVTLGAAGGGFEAAFAQTLDVDGIVSGSGDLIANGAGSVRLHAANTYTGDTRVLRGALVGDAASIRGDIANAGAVVFAQDTDARFAGGIAGLGATNGSMIMNGSGRLTLDGTSSLDWVVAQGALVSATDRFTGALDLRNAGASFTFDQPAAGSYAGVVSGAGALIVSGGGAVRLTGDSSGFAGTTAVRGGGALVAAGRLGGDVSADDGTVSGAGTIGGALSIGANGTLAGRFGETLSVGGDLTLTSGSSVNVALGGTSSAALFAVGRDLTLDGTLNVADAGGFAAGVYRLFDYGGRLADNGLAIGSAPDGVAPGELTVQTAVAGRVNLVSSNGADLGFWDGGNTALHDNGAVDGGSGTWRADARNWTDLGGAVNGSFRPNPRFAVFQGASGTVRVDEAAGAIGVTGIQFATDGYRVEGDAIALRGAGGTTTIRVGDGTAAGAATTATIAATLTGASSLVKDDRGTLVLTGANTYSGGTLVRAGTLVGDAGSIRGDIANAGTLVFDQAGDASFAGTIGGLNGSAGAMVKRGSGTLKLAGQSSLGWTVEAGDLVSATGRFGGRLDLASGTRFTFDQSTAGTYAGAVSGTGELAFEGGGTVLLTGNSSSFAGTTQVADATLAVNDRLGGSALIGSGGRLAGTGTIGSGAGSRVTIASGGMLAPGNSPGSLTVDGDLAMQPGSRYEVEVVPVAATGDLVKVTGTATLSCGTVVHVGLAGVYDPARTYTILTAGNGVTGRFAGVASSFAFLDPTLGYAADAVTLSLARNDTGFADVGTTRNQRATAAALDGLGAGNALHDRIVSLDGDTARDAFDGLSGEIHASTRTGLIEDGRAVRDAADARIRAAFGDVAASRSPVAAYGPDGPVLATPAADLGLAVWSSAYGSWGETDADGNAAGLDRDIGGVLIGADTAVSDIARLGIFGGYSHSYLDADARASSASVDSYHLGLYGGTRWNALSFRSGLAYSWHDVDTSRSVGFAGFTDTLSGSHDAGMAQAFAELGYSVETPVARLEPFTNLAYVNLHTDGFAERGGPAALAVHGDTTGTTFTTLGLRGERAFGLGMAEGRLTGTAGWRHAFGDTVPTATNAFAGSDAFTVAGAPIATDALMLEVGLEVAITSNTTLGLSYQGQIASSAQDHGLKANLGIRF